MTESQSQSKIDPDFDYHIQYPNGSNTQEEEFWPKSEKKLVVLMFGWVGGIDKHLEKYSEIYSKRGCIVIRYSVSVKLLFLESHKLHGIGAQMVQLLQDLKLIENPVICHSFSNGGTFVYSYTIKEMATRQRASGDLNLKLDFRGSIFDSAPSPRYPTTAFNAMAGALGDYYGFQYIVSGLMVTMLLIMTLWFNLKNGISYLLGFESSTYNSCRPEFLPHHHWVNRIKGMKNHQFLFLYSDTDNIVLPHHVENFAQITSESEGNIVRKKKFLATGHVSHYKTYPQEYVKEIREFIEKIMLDDGKPIFWEE